MNCITRFIQNYKKNVNAANGIFPEPPKVPVSKIKVALFNDQSFSGVFYLAEGEDFLAPWQNFIDWYENCAESEMYLFQVKGDRTAAVMVRRAAIDNFTIEVVYKKKPE